MDGIHYPVNEPWPFSKRYSCHKRGGKPALSYEFVLSIHKNKLKWVNGPFPAGKGDREILKENGLMQAFRQKKQERSRDTRLIANDGYTEHALLDCLSLRNEFDPREIAQFKNRVFSRHESFNGRTENYRCLSASFCHSHVVHQQCIQAICVTLQYEMDCCLFSLFDAYEP